METRDPDIPLVTDPTRDHEHTIDRIHKTDLGLRIIVVTAETVLEVRLVAGMILDTETDLNLRITTAETVREVRPQLVIDLIFTTTVLTTVTTVAVI